MLKKILLLNVFLIIFITVLAQKNYFVIGTYTDTIHLYSFDTINGICKLAFQYTGKKNPSYLGIHPSYNKIYATMENVDGEVDELNYDTKKETIFFAKSIKSGGAHPCYVSINADGDLLAVANYTGGNWSLIPLNSKGNFKDSMVQSFLEIGKGKFQQQNASHVHCVAFQPRSNFLHSINLGTDKIGTYIINKAKQQNPQTKLLHEFVMESGDGPRHITYHPILPIAYIINEIGGSVGVYKIKKGTLKKIQSIASDTTINEKKSCADIHLSHDGNFLYTSNRITSNGVSVFKVDKKGGLKFIAFVPTGDHPRNFSISNNDKWILVANKNSNTVQIFSRSIKTGLLKKMPYELSITQPVCLQWLH